MERRAPNNHIGDTRIKERTKRKKNANRECRNGNSYGPFLIFFFLFWPNVSDIVWRA